MLRPLGARLQADLHDSFAHRLVIAELGLMADGVVHGLVVQRRIDGVINVAFDERGMDGGALALDLVQMCANAVRHHLLNLDVA